MTVYRSMTREEWSARTDDVLGEATSVTVADGKYTVLHKNGTGLCALRYGEYWRDLAGDGLVLALVQEIEELRARLAGA